MDRYATMNEQLDVRFLAARKKYIAGAFSQLNPMQQEAVMATEGPLLLLAGAGSGKTTVLVNRVAHIIRYGNAYYSDAVPADLTEGTVEAIESMAGMPAEALDGVLTTGAQIGPAHQFIYPITHMGKTQIGDCVNLQPGHVHFKKVFHISFPRFKRSWAQSPVNTPVITEQAIIMGRYTARPGVAVTAMAMAIWPML